jgi:hypothetical protein
MAEGETATTCGNDKNPTQKQKNEWTMNDSMKQWMPPNSWGQACAAGEAGETSTKSKLSLSSYLYTPERS